MSIQLNTKYNLLDYLKNYISIALQIWSRSFHNDLPKVFFRYKTYRTHPGFTSYYNNPPVKWSNWYNADLLHWINYPKWIDSRPFLIESNDHPLSAVSWKKRVSEPMYVLRLIESAKTVYEHKNCRAILIPCEGFRDLFSHYFSENVNKKLIEVPQIICNQREVDWTARSLLPVAFCCLASDYFLKGVDLVIRAWFSIKNRNKSKLFLACPNIPFDVIKKLKSEKSIILITKAPLTAEEKAAIFNVTHVSLAPTHIHGGANVAEGLEYGHIPIMFEYHARYFRGIGSTISVPYHFYALDGYGKAWKTLQEFSARLAADKETGIFDCVIESLALGIAEMIENPEIIINSAKDCYRQASEHFSSDVRNKKLLALYQKNTAQTER